MRRDPLDGRQGSLFPSLQTPEGDTTAEAPEAKPAKEGSGKWRMTGPQGETVAQVRLLWSKRLTPAQVARVEAELNNLPSRLSKLGFGRVLLERAFIRRRKG